MCKECAPECAHQSPTHTTTHHHQTPPPTHQHTQTFLHVHTYIFMQFAYLESDDTFGSTFFAHSDTFQLCNNSICFCIHLRVDTCAGAPPGAANRTPKYASSYCNLYILKMFAHSGAHSLHIQSTFGHIQTNMASEHALNDTENIGRTTMPEK